MSISAQDLLKAKISDCINKCYHNNIPVFIGFLNENELSFCNQMLSKSQVKYLSDGGYECAVRQIVAFLPDWAETAEFPFSVVEFSYRKNNSLGHRDFLGALMGLGIERSKIGDIIVGDGKTVVFIHNDVLSFCLSQIDKIGNTGVKSRIVEKSCFEHKPTFENRYKTVASGRLDCIIAAICNCSRSNANQMINSGMIFVNQIECKNNSYQIKNFDTLSIRGNGKFVIDSLDELTKKGRNKLRFRKYI